jgi:membrane protein YdbS with pleckstrin-like domain
MSPLRIIEYLLLLVLVVGTGYLTYRFGFAWSRAGVIVIPLIIIVLLLIEDRKR